jgi:hypothetical protein
MAEFTQSIQKTQKFIKHVFSTHKDETKFGF